MLYKLSIIEINVRINTESYCFHLVSYLYLMYQNFLACAVEVCVKFSFQWKVWEKLSTIKFLTGEEYDWIYFTCCTKILHDQCSVLLFIRLFTFLTNNPSLALIGRNPFRACFFHLSTYFVKPRNIFVWFDSDYQLSFQKMRIQRIIVRILFILDFHFEGNIVYEFLVHYAFTYTNRK